MYSRLQYLADFYNIFQINFASKVFYYLATNTKYSACIATKQAVSGDEPFAFQYPPSVQPCLKVQKMGLPHTPTDQCCFACYKNLTYIQHCIRGEGGKWS